MPGDRNLPPSPRRRALARRAGLHPASPVAVAAVATYKWDPYELVFVGPAVDALPDPPGGRFHIDVAASRRLEPMGGELPESRPIQRPPASQPQPVQDSRDLPA